MPGPLFTKVIKPPYVRMRTAAANAVFDKRYGIDTDGSLTAADLRLLDPDSRGYAPAYLSTLPRILPHRQVDCDDVFVDIGSGKGRVVLQAALRYPFRRVYGVELAPELHEIALRNLEAIRDRLRCRDVRLVCGDALQFPIPDDASVFFFANPFVGELFGKVVDRLVESLEANPRRMRIVYVNPHEETTLLRTGRFRQVRQLRGWRPNPEWSRSNCVRLYDTT